MFLRSSKTTARWCRRLAALSLGLVAALAVLEIALRMGSCVPLQRNPLSGFHEPHPRLGWIGVGSHSARFVREEFDVIIESDADGFREPGHGTEPREAAKRIAVLGDSFTWGWGVAQGEVLTDRLQEALGDGYDVRNFGVNAYGTGQQWLLLRERIVDLEPDVAVVMFYDNDVGDNQDPKGGLRPTFEWRDGRLVGRQPTTGRGLSSFRALCRRSHALSAVRYGLNLLGDRWKAARRGWRSAAASNGPHAPGAPGPADGSGWRTVEALFARMKRLCDEHGIELRLVRIPPRSVLESPRPPPSPLEDVAARLELPYLDLQPTFRSHAWRRLYFAHDGHWSRGGHTLAAGALALALATP